MLVCIGKSRAILDQNFIRFEERDLFLDESFRRELKHRFSMHHTPIPCVFVNSVFFGVSAWLCACVCVRRSCS